MDEELMGQHIIFVAILLCILFFTYCAIPTPEPVQMTKKSYSGSKQHAQAAADKPDTRNDQHSTQAAVHNEAAADTLVQTTKEEAPAQQATALPEPQLPEKPMVKGPASLAVIEMNNPKYKAHKKGIVSFTHEKHVSEYAISCGSCHHDEKGAPLELTYDDPVQNCIECHVETEKPKGEKLPKKEKIAKYHFEAIHANCIGCHKTYNKEKGDPKGKGPAPISCTKCHPKTGA